MRSASRSLNALTLSILVAFAVVAVGQVYWSTFASDGLLGQPYNPRLVEAERAILRGTIVDRTGAILARSVNIGISPGSKPVVRRIYPHRVAEPAIGYYSLIYGVGGIEAAFDSQLRGESGRDTLQNDLDTLFHRVQVGSDLRLTLDIRLQTAIVEALNKRQGAVIVLDVPSGAVLAMVSEPSFDPNTLNETYPTLREADASPLLNRVTQGLYQPGGALETVILAALLANKTDPTAAISNATHSVALNGLTLVCAQEGPAITLNDAYAQACPQPFAGAIGQGPGAAAIQHAIETFGLLKPPTLIDFKSNSDLSITPLDQLTDAQQQIAEATGQGKLTVTPIQMALVAATIANHGNSIQVHLADAIRPPNTSDWQGLALQDIQQAVVTHDVADQVSAAMLQAVTSGAAQAAGRAGLDIRGHASLAYTGPGMAKAAWFIGFVNLPGNHSLAVATVIQDAPDSASAADVGGIALADAAKFVAP